MNHAATRSRRQRQIWILLLLAASASLIAAHTVYWQVTRHALQDGLQDWISRRIASGWRIETGPQTTGGWPLAAEVTLSRLTVTAPDRSRWESGRVTLRVDLASPGRLQVDAPGVHRVTLPDGTIRFDADQLHLDFPLTAADASATFNLAAREISTPLSLPFGSATLSASGSIRPVMALPEAGIATVVRQWHDRDGSLDLSRFALLWGPLDINGKAGLALDARLQPIGRASARITGYAQAITELAGAGRLPPQAAMLATMALNILAGDSRTAEVNLSLQANRLSMGPIPLLTVPDLAWPR